MNDVQIWKHHPGYAEARARVQAQTLDEDLRLIDALFGRDGLRYGDGPEAVKAEALRQLEIDFRSERNEDAEFWVNLAKADQRTRRGY
jgi:hypothetical protein